MWSVTTNNSIDSEDSKYIEQVKLFLLIADSDEGDDDDDFDYCLCCDMMVSFNVVCRSISSIHRW